MLFSTRRDAINSTKQSTSTRRAVQALATDSWRSCPRAFERLAAFPESGAKVRHRHPALEGCRFVLVSGFEKILVSHRVFADRIEIVRVLHGARDIESVLEDAGDETRQ